MSDPSATSRISGSAGLCRFILIRCTIPLQQPFSDSPGRQAVIAVVTEDALQRMGIAPGDKVATVLPNCIEQLEFYWGRVDLM